MCGRAYLMQICIAHTIAVLETFFLVIRGPVVKSVQSVISYLFGPRRLPVTVLFQLSRIGTVRPKSLTLRDYNPITVTSPRYLRCNDGIVLLVVLRIFMLLCLCMIFFFSFLLYYCFLITVLPFGVIIKNERTKQQYALI